MGAPPTIKLACTSWDQLAVLLESDLRKGLFRLRLSRQPPVGCDVRIVLTLPSEEAVTIGGRVARHAPEHDDSERGLGVEVLITQFAPEALFLIETSLRAARDRKAEGHPDALGDLSLPLPDADTWNDRSEPDPDVTPVPLIPASQVTPPPVGLSPDDLFSDLAPIDEAPPLPTGISALTAMPPEAVRANALLDGGQVEEALRLFDEVLMNRARDRDARGGKELALGYRALARNDRSAASRHFEKSLQTIPANDRAARALDALRRSPGQSGTRILARLLGKK